MSRLFTFGCSFTQYAWPTWANIIAYDTGIEHYNYGIAGLGNVGIQHRILEADIKHNFQKNDIILILWTSWCREDRLRNCRWLPMGSVVHDANSVYDNNFVKKYWDYSNDIVKNSTAIITANKIYKKNIKWQGSGFPLFVTESILFNHNNKVDISVNNQEKSLINLYNKKLPRMDIINTYVRDSDTMPFGFVNDCHPDVKKHLKYVTDYIYPRMNKKLKQSTVDRFNELQNYIESNFNKKSELKDFVLIIDDVLKNKFDDIKQTMNFNLLI